jgi:hypothetical protein
MGFFLLGVLGFATCATFTYANYQYASYLYRWKSTGLPLKDYDSIMAYILSSISSNRSKLINSDAALQLQYNLLSFENHHPKSQSIFHLIKNSLMSICQMTIDFIYGRFLRIPLGYLRRAIFGARPSDILLSYEILASSYVKIKGKVSIPTTLADQANQQCVIRLRQEIPDTSSNTIEDQMKEILDMSNSTLSSESEKNRSFLAGFNVPTAKPTKIIPKLYYKEWQCLLSDGTVIDAQMDDENSQILYDLGIVKNEANSRGLCIGQEVVIVGQLYILHPTKFMILPSRWPWQPTIFVSCPLSAGLIPQFERRYIALMLVSMASAVAFTAVALRQWFHP